MKPSSPPRTWVVTGAAGFIGSRVVERLRAAGLSVASVDELRYFSSRPEHRGIDFGETIDRDALTDWLEQNHASLAGILHMGAISATTELDEEKLRRINVEYSQNLWNFCAIRKLPFLYASSAATYGEGSEGYSDDESQMHRLRPLNPYGTSKLKFDLWALEQERLGNQPPAWAGFKFFNVYGFGERHKGPQASVVLHAFDQIRATGRVKLFRSHRAGIADGEQKRDFIFVDDVVDAMEFARKGGLRRGIYNLGTGEARSFLDLVRATFRAMGKPEAIDWIDTPVALRERYQYFTQAEMGKFRSHGYTQPFTRLEEGVRRTVERLSKA